MKKTKPVMQREKLPGDFMALVRMHPPAAVHNEVAYANAVEVMDALTSLPELNKDQVRYLDTLSVLVEAYEDEHHHIDVSHVSPVDALRQLMAEHDMSASDLGRVLGERSLGPKILNGDRDLSKAHVRKLADHFGVRADLFL
jgi:HTH-type transcriptional regulator/antitoxin HigA